MTLPYDQLFARRIAKHKADKAAGKQKSKFPKGWRVPKNQNKFHENLTAKLVRMAKFAEFVHTLTTDPVELASIRYGAYSTLKRRIGSHRELPDMPAKWIDDELTKYENYLREKYKKKP